MIYVNGRFLLQNLTGVNRFAYEICKAWVHMGVSFVLCCPPGEIKKCYDISHFNIIICGFGKSHFWEQFCLPFWFGKIKGEKILVNFTSLGPLLIRNKIITIHDLAFMVNPDWYSLPYRLWYKLMTPLCAATAVRVLTVSEFSKSEIIRRLSVNDERVCVIYNAVAALFNGAGGDENVQAKSSIKEKYILAVSSIDPRKNFAMLLKAFAYVKDKSVKLYIVGGQDVIYSISMAELSKYNDSERIKWLGRVNDVELKSYYRNALCFVYPSLYEGFGIPPLEAMACGTPTIVSSIPSLAEVCGNASLYVDPNDEKDIADKINRLINDDVLRKDLISKGHIRCSNFDWYKSASRLIVEINKCLACQAK